MSAEECPDLVTCPACAGRWWGEVCPVCDSWGVVNVARLCELAEEPRPAPGWLVELGREISVRNLGG